jgi:ribosome-associated protein
MPLAGEQSCRHRRIDAAAHCYDHALPTCHVEFISWYKLPSGALARRCAAIYSPTTPSTLTGECLLESIDLAERIADLLSERQAEDIVLMDISKVSTFTDHFVIATANNPRQMNALIESLDRDLRDEHIRPVRVEGTPDSGWVLVDFGDAIVHLFSPAERGYYNLESLWSKGVSIVHMQ